MTLETLQQCRNAAHALQKAQKAINMHESGAGCISGMHYGDMPRGRGEPPFPRSLRREEGTSGRRTESEKDNVSESQM